MRLIDADALIEDICESLNQMTNIGISVDGEWLWGKLNDALEHAPTIEERKTGMWLKGDEMPDYPRVPYKSWETYCSACRSQTEMETDYCPNCGADMRGEECI